MQRSAQATLRYLRPDAKTGQSDHIPPVRVTLLYLFIHQGFNTGYMLSKYSGERWSRLLVFAVKHFLRESPHAIPLWPFTLLLLVFHNAIWQIPLLVKCPFFLIHELLILVKINILTFNDQALIRIFALLNLATGRKPSFAEATEDKALILKDE